MVGVGLLGGSVGLAVRRVSDRVERIGIGRRQASLKRAQTCEAIDVGTTSFSRGLRDVDMVVVAAPLGQFPKLFAKMHDHLPPGCIVTDVGSTKGQVVRWAAEHLPKTVRFVGSHPMAGSELAGVEFARADLFNDAPCLITPTPMSDAAAVRAVRRFWQALGGRPHVLAPEAHDRILAEISHLPHALASVLVDSISSAKNLRFASTGFQDTTRIASGEAPLWRDIFLTNRKETIRAIDAFARSLKSLRQALSREDAALVNRILERAKKRRDRWMATRYTQREVSS